jgi:hypothetical protein
MRDICPQHGSVTTRYQSCRGQAFSNTARDFYQTLVEYRALLPIVERPSFGRTLIHCAQEPHLHYRKCRHLDRQAHVRYLRSPVTQRGIKGCGLPCPAFPWSTRFSIPRYTSLCNAMANSSNRNQRRLSLFEGSPTSRSRPIALQRLA